MDDRTFAQTRQRCTKWKLTERDLKPVRETIAELDEPTKRDLMYETQLGVHQLERRLRKLRDRDEVQTERHPEDARVRVYRLREKHL